MPKGKDEDCSKTLGVYGDEVEIAYPQEMKSEEIPHKVAED